ncbi:MAG TPA: cytochrome P450 [Acidimicrobiales bacterium]|nr:cytochrome P450 [Acidimicrobiales bacterium]
MDSSPVSSPAAPAHPMAVAGLADEPQPLYRAMREAAAVVPVDDSMVVVCRRAEIDETLRNSTLFSSNMSAVDMGNERPLIPLQIDPPIHKKYRKILDPIFSPKQMALLEPEIATLVNDLIDRFEDRDEIDFATEFSVPFPSQVFLTLLGLPLDELPRFLAMKDGVIRPEHVVGSASRTSDATQAHLRATAASIYEYFEGVVAERRVEGRDDILTRFLGSEIDGEKLTTEEILDISFLFLIAGLDTVTASLDCFFAYLAAHPDQRARLVADPGLVPSAVEELLRWETPVMGVVRVATEDTELGGCPIKAGQQVSVLLGAANTDDAEFGDGDAVLLDRDTNRHLAFGGGVHRCLGSHLARLELRVALREWHRRIPDYAVADGHQLSYTTGIRSIDHFPLVLGPRVRL